MENQPIMHVFHFRGLSSYLLLLLAIVAAFLIFMALPASFLMVLWNALIFEGAKGPEINLYQGFLLWGMVLVVLKLILKPEIQLEFIKESNAKDAKSSVKADSSLASSQDEKAKLDKPNSKNQEG